MSSSLWKQDTGTLLHVCWHNSGLQASTQTSAKRITPGQAIPSQIHSVNFGERGPVPPQHRLEMMSRPLRRHSDCTVSSITRLIHILALSCCA